MTTLITSIKRNPVVSFITLTLGLSLATFLLPVPRENAFVTIAFMLVMIPTIVAFSLVALMDGREGLRIFSREVFNWHVALKWVLIAFGDLGLQLISVNPVEARRVTTRSVPISNDDDQDKTIRLEKSKLPN
jgi:hypothetical protein